MSGYLPPKHQPEHHQGGRQRHQIDRHHDDSITIKADIEVIGADDIHQIGDHQRQAGSVSDKAGSDDESKSGRRGEVQPQQNGDHYGGQKQRRPIIGKECSYEGPQHHDQRKQHMPLAITQRATCRAAQVKKPAASSINEMMISATKVKVASQTIFQTTSTSVHWTTPSSSATRAPPSALQPIPNPLGCQITSTRVIANTASANMKWTCDSKTALIDPSGYRFSSFHALGIAIGEVAGPPPCQPGELHQFLTDIHDAQIKG